MLVRGRYSKTFASPLSLNNHFSNGYMVSACNFLVSWVTGKVGWNLHQPFKFIYAFVISPDPLTFDEHQTLMLSCSRGNEEINDFSCSSLWEWLKGCQGGTLAARSEVTFIIIRPLCNQHFILPSAGSCILLATLTAAPWIRLALLPQGRAW